MNKITSKEAFHRKYDFGYKGYPMITQRHCRGCSKIIFAILPDVDSLHGWIFCTRGCRYEWNLVNADG